jgi:hypothetical protein
VPSFLFPLFQLLSSHSRALFLLSPTPSQQVESDSINSIPYVKRYEGHSIKRRATAKANKHTPQAANQNRSGEPAPSGIGGKVEELAGKAAGCEGMEEEGKERQAKTN